MTRAPTPSSSEMHVKDPADFLKQAIGKNVIVKLNSGFLYKGKNLKENIN